MQRRVSLIIYLFGYSPAIVVVVVVVVLVVFADLLLLFLFYFFVLLFEIVATNQSNARLEYI